MARKTKKIEEANKKAKERIRNYDSEKEEISEKIQKLNQDNSMDRFLDFDYYLERCKQQSKKDSEVPDLPYIGHGFYTMKEIVNYATKNGLIK